jgi:branched-chain amino acid transport system substrate-binding protein
LATVRVAAALAGLALAAMGCRDRTPIRIGFVAGLTGRNYDLGVSERNGASLAVADLNRTGGIGGRPVTLLIRDDEQKPEVARRVVEELIAEQVLAIIGHATSSMAEATLPIANRERVLMVSPTVSASAFRGRDDWLVLLYPSTGESAAALADYLQRSGGAKRIVAFYDVSNRAYSESWHDQFKLALQAHGGQVVRSVPFESSRVPSFDRLVADALDPGVDGVVTVANALDSASICQQVRKRSQTIRLYGTDWGFTHDVLTHGGKAMEGAIFTQKVDVNDASPAFARFRREYEERYQRPVDFAAIMAYEATMVIGQGLRRDTTREGLRRAILEIGSFRGLQGDFRIDRFGDVQRHHFVMGVRDGKMVAIE